MTKNNNNASPFIGEVISVRRLINCLVIAFLFLLTSTSASAFPHNEDDKSPLKNRKISSFNVIGIDKGLSDNNIEQVLQDKRGFIWLATGHGLSRYDGFNIKSYFQSLSNVDSISSNSIKFIFQDAQDVIWVGTDKGLNRLNYNETGFIQYFSKQAEADSLSHNYITTISQDKLSRLWIGTQNGINVLIKGNQDKFKRYLVSEGASDTPIKVNFIQPYDTAVIVGTNQGLYQYDDKSDSFQIYNLNIEGIEQSSNFKTAFIDSSQTLWISIENKGVYFKTLQASIFEKLDSNQNNRSESIDVNSITAISEDSNGNIWLGSQIKGLFVYYPDTNAITSIELKVNTKNSSISAPDIQFIKRDNSGLMWVATGTYGALVWSPKTLHLQHFNERSLGVDDMSLDAIVWDFIEDDEQNIWLATYGGIKRLNQKDSTITPITIKAKGKKKEPQVYSITKENDNYWFATSDTLIRYKPGKGVIERITSEGKPNFSLPKNAQVSSVSHHNNVIYATIEGYDLHAFDLTNKTLKKIPLKGSDVNSPSSKRPLSVINSIDNKLWLLTVDGLFKYDPIEDSITIAIEAGLDQLSNNYVSALFEESEKSIWLGTSGNGINHLTINEDGSYDIEQFQQYGQLKYQIVNGLVLDNATPANLWISTHSGIFQLNRTTNMIRHFSDEDGVHAKEFNEGAYFLDSKGHIYFGAINGFNRINPIEFTTDLYEPPLRIIHLSAYCSEDIFPCNENFNIKNVKFTCEGSECNDKPMTALALPIELEQLEITFASLDFTSPHTNKYRYRLYSDGLYTNNLNFEKELPWINLLNKNSILFNKLKSANYSLEVQGTNNTGTWNKNIARLDFSIARPWYSNKYIHFLEVLFIVFTIYLIISRRRLRLYEAKRIELAIKKSEENFKFALWGSGDELWEWNISNDELIRTNQSMKFAKAPLSTKNTMSGFFEGVHPDDRDDTYNLILEHIKGAQPYYESFFRVLNTTGNYIWVLARARVVERDADNNAIRVLGSIKDITLIKATEDKLKLIAKAFENTMDGISILDPEFKSVLNNQAFYQITALTTSETINKQYFFSESSDNHEKYQQIKITLRNFGEWEGELWETRSNGDKFAIELKIDKVLDNNRQVSNYICIFSDITYRKRSEEELRKLANYDSLTKLPNRSLFMDRLSHAIASAKRSNTMFALLFIDLDHFKTINDSLGHSVGDELLRKVAQRLTRCVREADTVARLGGDEFVIILENIHDADQVGVCADKIIRRMKKSIEVSGTVLITSPSIGIGIYPEDGQDIETLIKNSDIAMYSAKEKGRNNYQFFTEEMTSSAVERLNIQNKLIEAIEKNQLELYYQPKVYSVTGELTGFEALIRWIHPEDGMISPADFIPVAEETGLIVPMGDWILEQAISQAKKWSEINASCCAIAINLSARQFQQENLPKTVGSLLEKYKLEPKYIELEITEGTLMANMEHAISTLKTLGEMGICLSLDDFGTGYSSLSYLKRFPVNKLKVDQSFVRDITTDPGDASIVASIITLAHNLGLNVVAEGCETLEQLKFICSYHCEEVQGYLFSRPLPRAEAEEILKQGEILIKR
ncbi:MAG: diguanylate cyclase (GGDEF)-like protein/PAS domain S-box-containing protein [Enterobacterales bacterium]|jgi:diguanylate cyclase (GGDEF)-like protein/PAS domain S-box-containing protein